MGRKKPIPPAVKYNRGFVPRAAMYARRGITPDEMAELFCVVPATIKNWIEKYPEFAKAIAEGDKAGKIEMVEGFFIDQALPHDEVTDILRVRGKGKNATLKPHEQQIRRRVVDTRAGERILKAYKSETYGDKTQLTGDVSVKINVTKKYVNSDKKKPNG